MSATTKNQPITAELVSGIAEGKCYAMRDRDDYVLCARRGGTYVIECGWAVPETYDDDPGCSTYWPFAGRRRDQAWVGRTASTDDPASAAELYEAYLSAVCSRQGYRLDGERIGSVSR